MARWQGLVEPLFREFGVILISSNACFDSGSLTCVGMIVPGLSFGIAFHLSWVGLAQADNTHGVSAKTKHPHMQAVVGI